MIIPEKTQKRKLGKDPPSDQKMIGTTSSLADENQCLLVQDFEDFSNKIENSMSKRLRATEHSQSEVLARTDKKPVVQSR